MRGRSESGREREALVGGRVDGRRDGEREGRHGLVRVLGGMASCACWAVWPRAPRRERECTTCA
eukprot:3201922-Prymnesium_polylepis.1